MTDTCSQTSYKAYPLVVVKGYVLLEYAFIEGQFFLSWKLAEFFTFSSLLQYFYIEIKPSK